MVYDFSDEIFDHITHMPSQDLQNQKFILLGIYTHKGCFAKI